jgi:predicted permease
LVVRPFREDISGTLERPLFLLLAAVGLVLLVACANVANLVLSRSIGRGREFALRVALGAGRGILIRLLLCEAALLCTASGAIGVALAYAVIRAAPALLVQVVPNLHSLSIDWRVLAFTAALAIGTTLIVGLVPLAVFARHDPGGVLRGGTSQATAGAGRLRLQRGFVVLTVGIACVLLVASGLFTQSLGRLVRADVHFEPEQVLTVAMTLPNTAYRSAASVRAFYGALERDLGTVPGVTSVALTTDLPLTNYDLTVFTPDQGGPPDLSERMMYISYVSGPYFEALGIPRLGGRFFEPAEHERDRGVVVVNEKLAERAWPGLSAVGRRLKLTDANGAAPWLTVVGVVKNVSDGPAGTDPGMHAWVPIRQMSDATLDTVTHQYGRDLKLVILAEGDLQTLAGTVRRRIAALDPQLALERVAPMADRIGDAFRQRRAGTLIVAAFAGLALLLASVGLYGVLASMTAERRREIAVRMAMGATGREVMRLVLRQTAILVGIGLAIGLPASAGTARIIVALLYQPESFDLQTFATVAAVLTGVALIACAVPAWRATRVDPAIVLRAE